MSDDDQMRVSSWEKEIPQKGASTVKSAYDFPEQTVSASEEENKSPLDALPIDPLRYIQALWEKKMWILTGLLLGLALGGLYGILFTKTRYEVSAQIMKREVPSSFRIGEFGEPFKPRDLSNSTLIGTATSLNVLKKVSEKSEPHVPLGILQNSVEAKEQKNTDFVFLTVSGYDSAQATVNLANLWAQEVVSFSRELQSQESREVRKFLQQKLDVTDKELNQIREEYLALTVKENIVSADKEIDAYLRSIGDYDLKYETARIDLETTDFKIRNITKELRRQSPLSDQLREAESELDSLRAQYTEQNPLVLEKIDKINSLKEVIHQMETSTNLDLSAYAGNFLGNTLFLQLIGLENEKKTLQKQKDELLELREKAKQKLDAIPKKTLALAEISQRKQGLETARNLLDSRLREALLFEDNALGYYRIFAEATLQRVKTKDKLLKVTMYAGAGAFALSILSFSLILIVEFFNPYLKTVREASQKFKAPVLLSLAAENPTPPAETGSKIWVSWIGSHIYPGKPRAIWCPTPCLPGEELFWSCMIGEARKLLNHLLIIDTVPESPRVFSTLDILDASTFRQFQTGFGLLKINPDQNTLDEINDFLIYLKQFAAQNKEVWIRLSGPVVEPSTSIARVCMPPLILIALGQQKSSAWSEFGKLLKQSVKPAEAIITLNEQKWILRI